MWRNYLSSLEQSKKIGEGGFSDKDPEKISTIQEDVANEVFEDGELALEKISQLYEEEH